MKRFEELLVGVLLFYITDRAARLTSAMIADRRDMNTLETERLRCTIEIIAMVTFFIVMWSRLKR
jgi:hypothetical protein